MRTAFCLSETIRQIYHTIINKISQAFVIYGDGGPGESRQSGHEKVLFPLASHRKNEKGASGSQLLAPFSFLLQWRLKKTALSPMIRNPLGRWNSFPFQTISFRKGRWGIVPSTEYIQNKKRKFCRFSKIFFRWREEIVLLSYTYKGKRENSADFQNFFRWREKNVLLLNTYKRRSENSSNF